jgi:hypothetical protein
MCVRTGCENRLKNNLTKNCESGKITVDLKKPKELVKEPSTQSFGSLTSSSIKPVRFFENFQKSNQEFILEIFQKP